jgi:Mce-associated membrane protein
VKRWAGLAVLLALAGCTTTVSGAARPEPESPPANFALVNPAQTGSVLGAVKTAVEAVFSYDSTALPAHEKAANEHLTPAAREEVAKLLTEVRNSPEPIKLVTRVIVSAAVEQAPDKARVLTVLDQTSTQAGTTRKGIASVLLGTVREGDRWRIDKIEVTPSRVQLPPEKPGAGDRAIAVARDSARDGGLRIAEVLLNVNPADPEGTYARYESVSTGPLLTQFQQGKAAQVDRIRSGGTKSSMDPKSIAAVMELVGDKASVLLFATTNVTDAQGTTQPKYLPIVLRLQRLPEGWKAAGIEMVQALP